MAASTSAASAMRMALNSSGVASRSAFLMTTKVAPHTSVTRISRTWAFSVRDTGDKPNTEDAEDTEARRGSQLLSDLLLGTPLAWEFLSAPLLPPRPLCLV